MADTIRILHVLGNTNLGGAESRIMDLYRHMDLDRVQFDFLVHTQKEGYFDKEIAELGGRIFRVPRFRIYNYFSYKKALAAFFREHHEFKMVQGHITSCGSIYLPLAKKAGIPVTIAHARSAGVDNGIKGILTRLLRLRLSEKTDYMFSCSKKAGAAVFGEKALQKGNILFVPNAIECDAFAFQEDKRRQIREELGVEKSVVIGHVGRFHYAKNHEYLLHVFKVLCQKEEGFELLLLGEGDGRKKQEQLAGELGIADKVHFLGNRKNIADYYQAMDYFVYPSRYEGLPGAVIEAQAAGLRCLISDTICEEVLVTDLVKTMSIEEKPDTWADAILQTKSCPRRSYVPEIQAAGFDVHKQAEMMMRFYILGNSSEFPRI